MGDGYKHPADGTEVPFTPREVELYPLPTPLVDLGKFIMEIGDYYEGAYSNTISYYSFTFMYSLVGSPQCII